MENPDMTVSEVYYPPHDFKVSTDNNQPSYKILLKTHDPELFTRLETYGRGGGARAKYRKVREMYVDKENRIYAGYEMTDKERNGTSYEYIIIGRLQVVAPRERRFV
jgi:hypothetical protein